MDLLKLENISVKFPVRKGFWGKATEFVGALNGVSLTVAEGESLGVVGESGCGKSTLARVALSLITPNSGKIEFSGEKKDIQIVFQDPFASLNPRMTVGNIIAEPLLIHNICSSKNARERVRQLLEEVDLDPDLAERYPHEFSGGQRQRISIARAIALKPKLVVADEPVSSLDVAVQSEVLALLKDLQKTYNMAYLFISHDFRVVSKFCDRVAVMYLGDVVELLPAKNIASATHPYTDALFSAVPKADPFHKTKRKVLMGDVPSPINIPGGCPFHPRCQYKTSICEKVKPVLENKTEFSVAACHNPLINGKFKGDPSP